MNRPIAPLYATVNITGVCNLNCRYCFYQPRDYHLVMKLPDFKLALNELKICKVFLLNISGGEPFTHPEFSNFLQTAYEYFEHTLVITNGTILTKEHKEVIEDIIQKNGRFPIQVSLDSINPKINRITRSDPEIVVNNIKTLHKIGARVSVAIVVSLFNIHDVPNTIKGLRKYTDYFHLMPFQPVKYLGRKDSEYEVKDKEMKEFWKDICQLREDLGLNFDTPLDEENANLGCAYGVPCQAAFSHVVIDSDLNIRPCDRVTDAILGNLSESSLIEIWNSKESLSVLNRDKPLCCD
ncbi:MAG: radical SAM protein [Candidatus Heimdallarchaeota archaeon]|nr:radical SAM protein [Candidatus Heimdallarchaeota archaeon]